jgi:hypothetical protein
MPFILNLTELIASCKPHGQYGIIPVVFAREIAGFHLRPDTRYPGNLGENQWWLRLGAFPPSSPPLPSPSPSPSPPSPP